MIHKQFVQVHKRLVQIYFVSSCVLRGAGDKTASPGDGTQSIP